MRSARCVGRRVLRCLLAFGSPPVLERTDGQSALRVPLSADAGNLQQTMEDVKIKTGFGGACAFLSLLLSPGATRTEPADVTLVRNAQ